MAPLRQIRRSRRLSHKSPMEVADYDWPSLQLLHGGSNVETTPSAAIHLPPPSPSACTTTESDSPPSIVTHLPFTPGSSHTRNRKQGHIPRPPNAFMIFRSWLWNKDNLKSVEKDNRNVSRIAGRYWNELSEAERAPFRCMAEEAKARHAQLYPEYRYSPGSQKKPKVSQRRSQRCTDIENERCKKVADLLLGGVTSRDLTKYLGEGNRRVGPEEEGASVFVAEQTSSGSLSAAPRNVFKRPAARRGESPPLQPKSKKPKTLPGLTPPSQYAVSLPILPVTGERSETTTQIPGLLGRTPELAYPPVEMFVATDDIPYLSLDCFNDLTAKMHEDDDLSTLFPSHLKPGAHSVFSGVKPEATSFVDSCVFGAHTTDVLILPTPVPFTEFDIESYSSLVPLGSPVFSNPFELSTPTAMHTALLGTLDQLFGQPISPLTPIFPNEN